MIYILIDTNIFYQLNFDVGHDYFRILNDLVKNKKISVLTNDILSNEYINNIDKRINVTRSSIRSALKEKNGLFFMYRVGEEKGNKAILKHFDEYWEINIKKTFLDFLEEVKPIDIGISSDSIQVFSDYFKNKPPFENNKNKKSEFPDSFIVYSLKKWIGDFNLHDDDEVYIISQDKGMGNCCKELGISIFDSLTNLFDYISQLVIKENKNLLSEISKEDFIFGDDSLKSQYNLELINEIIDKHISENINPEDIYIDNLENDEEVNSFEVSSIDSNDVEVINLEENVDDLIVEFNISVDVGLEVEFSYTDYENSPYDGENHDYLWLDIEDRKIETVKTLDFLVSLTIDNSNHKLFNELTIKDIDYSVKSNFDNVELHSEIYDI